MGDLTRQPASSTFPFSSTHFFSCRPSRLLACPSLRSLLPPTRLPLKTTYSLDVPTPNLFQVVVLDVLPLFPSLSTLPPPLPMLSPPCESSFSAQPQTLIPQPERGLLSCCFLTMLEGVFLVPDFLQSLHGTIFFKARGPIYDSLLGDFFSPQQSDRLVRFFLAPFSL